ncbi:hypothetical protein SAMN04488027_104157 [Psychroflexus sediminis]|uniref:Uncharacterized protein n=1 Tax=Psychroflexus sediminis TaxID=470826 RepID=A0A1G7VTY2_9FLAO|nr:hypothetical protein SAMN04488027_104157 [Psychroflexus sediminis]
MTEESNEILKQNYIQTRNDSSPPRVRYARGNPAVPKALGGGIETGRPALPKAIGIGEGHAPDINNPVSPEFSLLLFLYLESWFLPKLNSVE